MRLASVTNGSAFSRWSPPAILALALCIFVQTVGGNTPANKYQDLE
jgi:hypothetical protein